MMIDVGIAMTLLAGGFGVLSWVLSWGVRVIRKEMAETRKVAGETAHALVGLTLTTEKRLTMLETEFGFMRRYLTKLEHDDDDPR